LKIDRIHINNTVSDFCLNEEQECAFKIVVNHSVDPTSEQLLMYLGGMAGTGKSQVIKALVNFFERKNQPYLFLIMAPTGSAAALIDGSTYHSVLEVMQVNLWQLWETSEPELRMLNMCSWMRSKWLTVVASIPSVHRCAWH
jgi:PIF1-like helicase